VLVCAAAARRNGLPTSATASLYSPCNPYSAPLPSLCTQCASSCTRSLTHLFGLNHHSPPQTCTFGEGARNGIVKNVSNFVACPAIWTQR
jgi:hypothetical protein